MNFRLPNSTQRVAVIGRTGSGKSQFGTWLLSKAPFDAMPYVIVDYKGDELLNSIDGLEQINLKYVPKYPGLYIVRPRPDEAEHVEAWLWKIWARERIGLFFDETSLVPDPVKGGAFRAILTQGRSKQIPAICLTQRPAWISKFIFSEADFFAILHLSIGTDKARVKDFVPGDWKELPEYHTRWYDVTKHKEAILTPVPNSDRLLDDFAARMRKRRKKV